MKKNTACLILTPILVFALSVNSLLACTNIVIKAQNGSVVVARTMEFGPSLESNIMTSPQGRQINSPAPDGSKGLSWQAKYGFIFMDYFGSGKAVDGMNDQGLSFGALYLPNYAQYQTVPQGKENQALSYQLFGDWVLSHFSTVDEVKSAVQNIYVFAEPQTFGSNTNVVFPLHFIVTDASGKSITIEYVKGRLHVYDNPAGVLTNSPTFDWQMNNLKNYANLSPFSPKAINIDGYNYSGTGQGAGAMGLPGDFSPPSRFVKMTFLTQSAYPVSNAKAAVNLAQHIINDVDIPNGVVRGVKGSNAQPDITQWTVFKDLKNKVLYFKSYDNTTLQAIDLTKLNLKPGAAQLKMPITSSQIIIDATKKLQNTQ